MVDEGSTQASPEDPQAQPGSDSPTEPVPTGPDRRRRVLDRAASLGRDERTKAVVKTVGGIVATVLLAEQQRRRSVAEAPPNRATAQGPSDPVPPPAWPPVGWQVGPAAVPSVPSAPDYPPFELSMTFAGSGHGERHPQLPDLCVEVSRTSFRESCLAIDWEPRLTRFYFELGEIPTDWSVVWRDEHRLPLEVRRSGPTSIMCRWLEPAAHELREAAAQPARPATDPRRTERRLRDALRSIDQTRPRW